MVEAGHVAAVLTSDWRRAEAECAGEWSVTAENSLGCSTRDWRVRVVAPAQVRPLLCPRSSVCP